ncbi:hypothetical protein CL634_06850 [bacterium]|nr:hypothetical protein [bacterium]
MKHKKEDAKWFIACLVVVFLIITCIIQSGCSSTNGFCRDVRSISEAGINVTQPLVERQRSNSIAFGITEQNRIMSAALEMQTALAQ